MFFKNISPKCNNRIYYYIELFIFLFSPNLYVRVNDHIVVRGDRTGYIRYIGHLNKIGPPNTVFIGLELDAPGKTASFLSL